MKSEAKNVLQTGVSIMRLFCILTQEDHVYTVLWIDVRTNCDHSVTLLAKYIVH